MFKYKVLDFPPTENLTLTFTFPYGTTHQASTSSAPGRLDSLRPTSTRSLVPSRPVVLTRRNCEVVNFTWYRVKNYSILTNFRKFTKIEGYNDKYGLNPQGIKEFLDVIFKFDQIGQEIDGINEVKWYFKKEDFKSIPWNQESSNLDLISGRNRNSKWRENFGRKISDFR